MAAVVTTIRDRCKRCYTCVRNCPAKAIKVEDGQAKVMEERCIACGSCYKVCAQSAKQIESGVEAVWEFLSSGQPVIAALAPSFPAAFDSCSPGQLVTAVKRLGFAEVMEVAFGAELVGRAYAALMTGAEHRTLISTPCPAIVSLIEKYYPSLIPFLAPIVSPAIAIGRAIKSELVPCARVVFIGPCVAKKHEIRDEAVAGALDAAITYRGLRRMLNGVGIDPSTLPESDTDGPKPRLAGAFPLPGGLLKTAALQADVLETDIVVAEGKEKTLHLIRELNEGHLSARFLDLLFCDGCIDGPVMETSRGLFARRQAVGGYVKSGLSAGSAGRFQEDMARCAGVDLRRGYHNRSLPLPAPSEEEITRIMVNMKKLRREDELNCGACGYSTCREKATAVFQGLAEPQMCLPYLVDQLQENLSELERYQLELESTQDQLIQSEKLASMGQLAAGVAHEINNPLGTITIYAHMMIKEAQPGDPRIDDLRMIVDEASRCRTIVAGLLEFARQRRLEVELCDLNALAMETVAELKRQPFFVGVNVTTHLDAELPLIAADPFQLRQALTNLLRNGAEAMPRGGVLTVSSGVGSEEQHVWLSISDTGCGIAEENLAKLFTPFFTTKRTGKGTGLGLAIAYGIVKMHRGSIDVRSALGEGATFTITLPTGGRRVHIAGSDASRDWVGSSTEGAITRPPGGVSHAR